MESPNSYGEVTEYLDTNIIDDGETSTNNTQSNRMTDILFAIALRKHGTVLLKKSQTPGMKIKKKHSVKEMIDYIVLEKGFKVSN